ncbi:phage tail protein, partial [Citrobacter freundii]|nr:phage tail protein [Citrobacter freundii]EKU2554003.1 phage tail protein [Citrobacter freundii]
IDGGFEIPVDRNKQPRIWLDYKVNADGSVLVRTYHRVHPSAPPFAQNRIGNTDIDGVFTETVADGEPVDIPADSFVSVRVEMPEDSIWNRIQKETREAIEKAERERQQNQQDTQS